MIRFLCIATAIAATIIAMIIIGYSVASVRNLLSGDSSELIVLVSFSLFLCLLVVVIASMIRELRRIGHNETSNESRVTRKLGEDLYTLIKGEPNKKLSLLKRINDLYSNGQNFPKKVTDHLICAIDLERDDTIRQILTEELIKASHLIPGEDPYRFLVDTEIVNFLRLRVFEEPDVKIRALVLSAFGELFTRIDSPVGSVNMEIGQSLVATLTMVFDREEDESVRIAAFKALTQVWCLDLMTSEKVVRAAINDENEKIRDIAKCAVEYAFEDV